MTLETKPEEVTGWGGAPGAFLRCLRPAQWIKNLIVFAGVVFANRLFEEGMFLRATAAFAVFCGLAGAQYVFNDYKDLESDRQHPTKRLRPLASGQINATLALAGALCVILASFVGAYALGKSFAALAFVYLVLSLSYTFFLKHQVILDVFAIALGFVIRAAAGAVVITEADIAAGREPSGISDWLLVCTLFLALFLGLSKRRAEVSLLGEDAAAHRKALGDYSLQFLDQMIAVVTSSTVLAYTLFTVSNETHEYRTYGTHYLVYTVPFVLYGIFRYLFLVFQLGDGGSPTAVLLRDRGMQLTVVGWVITVTLIVYRARIFGS